VPWAYDEEAVEVVRFFARLKASLMPYLYRNAIETASTGVPSMRSMVMEFTDDPACAYLDKQYMLGDQLLVAPIFNEEGMAKYYLPEGHWTDYFTGEVKEGCRWYKEKHGYLSIPLLVKENSILAVGSKEEDAVYDYSENVSLKVYELQEGVRATTAVYNQDRELGLHAELLKKDNRIEISVQASKDYRVVLVNCTSVTAVTNGSFSIEGKDTILNLGGNETMTCILK
jgi:alpha-D-xyloside xylohydrolase